MSIVAKLQNIFGVSKAELTISSIILFGLIIGLVIKTFDTEKNDTKVVNQQIYSALDSLAEAQKTTYTGTDIKNNTNPKLEKGDTVIKKTGFQPKPKITSGSININTASKLELMKLPGVGESTALKIIEYRTKHPFTMASDIMYIKGIGKKKFEKMKAFIDVK
ncbi:MAG: helix-hairpin-helix domain-containing protein [bacterium]